MCFCVRSRDWVICLKKVYYVVRVISAKNANPRNVDQYVRYKCLYELGINCSEAEQDGIINQADDEVNMEKML